jgi:hypothetical protein
MFNKIIDTIFMFLAVLDQTRRAAALARRGDTRQAKELMKT